MFDDRALALFELSRDMLFHKIPVGRYGYYIDGSLAAGFAAAEQFGGQDIMELYRDNGIAVEYRDKSGDRFGVTLRGQAEMSKNGCRVNLYTDSLRALAEHSGAGDLPQLDYEQALRVHLAHEFYHFWEYKNGDGVTDHLEKVETLRLFGFSRRATVNRCGEIAAHAFAKGLLGLPVLPNLYDYLYLVGTGKMSMEAISAQIETLRVRLDDRGDCPAT